jgi:hypothetical protein
VSEIGIDGSNLTGVSEAVQEKTLLKIFMPCMRCGSARYFLKRPMQAKILRDAAINATGKSA